MKKTLLALSCMTFMSAAQADVIGLYLGGEIWDNSAEGSFGESSNMANFNLKDQTQGSYFIAVEHPLPFIPNAKIRSTNLDTEGSTTLTQSYSFGGETFSANTAADAAFDVSYIDYTLYYEILDIEKFSVDFGITARDFDGTVQVTAQSQTVDDEGNTVTTTITGTENLSQFVPMLYARTQIGLPFTGVNFFAEGNFLSFDDHTLYDYMAGVSYDVVDNIAVDVSLTAGYRSVKLELDDLDNLYSDIEFDGVFVGLVVHF